MYNFSIMNIYDVYTISEKHNYILINISRQVYTNNDKHKDKIA